MATTYYEILPESCPEIDAKPASNEKFYRLIRAKPAINGDFQSKRMKQPNALFKDISECILSAVSIYKQTEMDIKKLPSLKGKIPAIITLTPTDGLIKQTFTNPHYSWWRAKEFEIENSITYI